MWNLNTKVALQHYGFACSTVSFPSLPSYQKDVNNQIGFFSINIDFFIIKINPQHNVEINNALETHKRRTKNWCHAPSLFILMCFWFVHFVLVNKFPCIIITPV